MAVTPNTDVFLLKCPIEIDDVNQINFASATAQYNYFSSLPKLEAENFTYQRKDSIIRFPAHIDTLLEYNYVMYRNTSYGSKWFYAFITDMQYINDNMTAITIKTDVWQTWQFGLTFKKSFVEREHVSDDTFGLHTVPEGLDTGEYICNGSATTYTLAEANNSNIAPVILFQVTKTTLKADGMINYTFPSSVKQIYCGIPQGCACFGIRLDANATATMASVCGLYDAYGAGDAIVAISLVPYFNASVWTTGTDTGGNSFLVPVDSWGAHVWHLDPITRNSTLDGYTPKNNKLFTREFNYLYMSNNAGGDITYYWEDFATGEMDFDIAYAVEQGGSAKLYPTNSNKSGDGANISNGWTEGLQAPKLPVVSWVSDYYLNWKAVNGKNVVVQSTLSALGWAGGVISTMGGGGMSASTLSFASGVANTMQQIKEAQMTPPQAKGNVSTGDITFAQGNCGFIWRKMSVRAEYAQRIDDYLSAFGYRVNSFKVPQYTSRPYWNFVKTKGAVIEGNVPQSDLQEIKDMFNNGVTIWHDTSHFLDYSQNNAIVTTP